MGTLVNSDKVEAGRGGDGYVEVVEVNRGWVRGDAVNEDLGKGLHGGEAKERVKQRIRGGEGRGREGGRDMQRPRSGNVQLEAGSRGGGGGGGQREAR